jgi:hypothetical protein
MAPSFESSEVQTDDSAAAGRRPIRRDAGRSAAPKTLRLMGPAETPRRCIGWCSAISVDLRETRTHRPAGDDAMAFHVPLLTFVRLANLEWVMRAPQQIHLLLLRKVKLANCAGRKSDVSLGPASERKIFLKMSLGAELRAPGRRAAVKIGKLAVLAGVSTRTRVAPWQWPAS